MVIEVIIVNQFAKLMLNVGNGWVRIHNSGVTII